MPMRHTQGKSCDRLGLVALSWNGMELEQILSAYPTLEAEDVRQVLKYAAWLADESVLPAEAGSA